MKKKYRFLLLAAGMFFAPEMSAQFTDGVFVLNEGGAGSGNASVTYLSDDFAQVQYDVFGGINSGEALGDTGQSMGFHGDKAYVVLNISNEIKVVNRSTFALIATITGLSNPRFIAFRDNFAYVTCWGDGGDAHDDYVAVIDLATNVQSTTISVNEGPERILQINGKLYVAHQGGYGFGNSISVIDSASHSVTATLAVGDVPNSIVENNGFLYVLCGGKPFWASAETDGALSKIDLATDTVVSTVPFTAAHPANLEIAGGQMFYSVDADIFKADLTATAWPAEPLFSIAPQGAYGVYGMDILNDQLYVGDAVDYASPGKVYVYSLEGDLLQNITVGVIPNSFYKTDASLGVVKNAQAISTVVYPNPVADKFYIHTQDTAAIKMYDSTGRLVKNQPYSVSGIDVLDLNSGLYLVDITIGNQSKTVRICIK